VVRVRDRARGWRDRWTDGRRLVEAELVDLVADHRLLATEPQLLAADPGVHAIGHEQLRRWHALEPATEPELHVTPDR
jgi:hypothetical protein